MELVCKKVEMTLNRVGNIPTTAKHRCYMVLPRKCMLTFLVTSVEHYQERIKLDKELCLLKLRAFFMEFILSELFNK